MKYSNNSLVKQSKKNAFISCCNKTNPIRFKEKFDFFYYHSLNILENDQANEKDLFVQTLISNFKLSNNDKEKLKKRRCNLYDNNFIGIDIRKSSKEILQITLNKTSNEIKDINLNKLKSSNSLNNKIVLKKPRSTLVSSKEVDKLIDKQTRTQALMKEEKDDLFDYIKGFKQKRFEDKKLNKSSGREIFNYYKQKEDVIYRKNIKSYLKSKLVHPNYAIKDNKYLKNLEDKKLNKIKSQIFNKVFYPKDLNKTQLINKNTKNFFIKLNNEKKPNNIINECDTINLSIINNKNNCLVSLEPNLKNFLNNTSNNILNQISTRSIDRKKNYSILNNTSNNQARNYKLDNKLNFLNTNSIQNTIIQGIKERYNTIQSIKIFNKDLNNISNDIKINNKSNKTINYFAKRNSNIDKNLINNFSNKGNVNIDNNNSNNNSNEKNLFNKNIKFFKILNKYNYKCKSKKDINYKLNINKLNNNTQECSKLEKELNSFVDIEKYSNNLYKTCNLSKNNIVHNIDKKKINFNTKANLIQDVPKIFNKLNCNANENKELLIRNNTRKKKYKIIYSPNKLAQKLSNINKNISASTLYKYKNNKDNNSKNIRSKSVTLFENNTLNLFELKNISNVNKFNINREIDFMRFIKKEELKKLKKLKSQDNYSFRNNLVNINNQNFKNDIINNTTSTKKKNTDYINFNNLTKNISYNDIEQYINLNYKLKTCNNTCFNSNRDIYKCLFCLEKIKDKISSIENIKKYEHITGIKSNKIKEIISKISLIGKLEYVSLNEFKIKNNIKDYQLNLLLNIINKKEDAKELVKSNLNVCDNSSSLIYNCNKNYSVFKKVNLLQKALNKLPIINISKIRSELNMFCFLLNNYKTKYTIKDNSFKNNFPLHKYYNVIKEYDTYKKFKSVDMGFNYYNKRKLIKIRNKNGLKRYMTKTNDISNNFNYFSYVFNYFIDIYLDYDIFYNINSNSYNRIISSNNINSLQKKVYSSDKIYFNTFNKIINKNYNFILNKQNYNKYKQLNEEINNISQDLYIFNLKKQMVDEIIYKYNTNITMFSSNYNIPLSYAETKINKIIQSKLSIDTIKDKVESSINANMIYIDKLNQNNKYNIKNKIKSNKVFTYKKLNNNKVTNNKHKTLFNKHLIIDNSDKTDTIKNNKELLKRNNFEISSDINQDNNLFVTNKSNKISACNKSIKIYNEINNNYLSEANISYIKNYEADNYTKKESIVNYKGFKLDIYKVLKHNKSSVLNHINPNSNYIEISSSIKKDRQKTYKNISSSKNYKKLSLKNNYNNLKNIVKLDINNDLIKSSIIGYSENLALDVDIIEEYMFQKVFKAQNILKNLNPKKLKEYFEENYLPNIKNEFNSLFSIYPKDLQEFMKMQYLKKYGNPFKNYKSRLNMYIKNNVLKSNKENINNNKNNNIELLNNSLDSNNKRLKKSDDLLKIEELLSNYKLLNTVKKYTNSIKQVGNIIYLDIPQNFSNLEGKVINTLKMERKIKKFNKIKTNEYLSFISKPKKNKNYDKLFNYSIDLLNNKKPNKFNLNYKNINLIKLKDYNIFNKSLDFLFKESLKNNNKLVKIQQDYADSNMYCNPSRCVLKVEDHFNKQGED